MDLWIRSQNKEILVKIINFSVVEYKDEFRIVGFSADEMDESDLGCYETKERALEVLDKIQRVLSCALQANNNNQICGTTTYVYEMPKE